jgi:hypothetical protein
MNEENKNETNEQEDELYTEENGCYHDDLENGFCIDCGVYVGFADSYVGDLER